MAEIRALGLEPQVQEATAVGTRYPAAGHVKNVLALRAGAPLEHDVIASSLSVTIYWSLPNDTDLSELSLLGTPARRRSRLRACRTPRADGFAPRSG